MSRFQSVLDSVDESLRKVDGSLGRYQSEREQDARREAQTAAQWLPSGVTLREISGRVGAMQLFALTEDRKLTRDEIVTKLAEKLNTPEATIMRALRVLDVLGTVDLDEPQAKAPTVEASELEQRADAVQLEYWGRTGETLSRREALEKARAKMEGRRGG